MLEYKTMINVDNFVDYEKDLSTALYVTAHSSHYTVLHILLKNDADIHTKDYYDSVLMTAVYDITLFFDFTEVVEILLQHRLNILYCNKEKQTPLNVAVSCELDEVVELLKQ